MQNTASTNIDSNAGDTEDLKSIKLCGRGGQGIVTAGELLALAAFEENKYAQAIPNFGAERRGGPAFCSLRISNEPILLKCSVTELNAVSIFDSTIWHHRNLFGGLKSDGILIFNSKKTGEEINEELSSKKYGYTLPIKNYEIFTIDATTLALENLKKPIVNTAMMGAFAKATGYVSIDSIMNVMGKEMKRNVDENKKLVQTSYESVQKYTVKE